MDPMHAAISKRRAKHFDPSVLSAPEGQLPGSEEVLPPTDAQGDLAPETGMDPGIDPELDPELAAAGPMEVDPLGQEQVGQDDGFEQMMQQAHNPSLEKPKTLSARVAAAMQSKKGKA